MFPGYKGMHLEVAETYLSETGVEEPALPTSAGLLDLALAVTAIWMVEVAAAIGLFFGFETYHPLGILGASLVSTAGTLFIAWYFLCGKYRLPFAQGFAITSVDRRTALASFMIGAIGALIGSAVISAAGTDNDFITQLTSTQLGLCVVIFLGLVLPPFEELYYRGFLFAILRRRLGNASGVILVTVWFAAAHGFQLAGNWVAVLFILFMSGVWTMQRHLTNSLLPSMISHWTYNTGLVLITVLLEMKP